MINSIIPISRHTIEIRAGVAGDLAFIDSLQKKTTKMVGWMPTKQIEGKIAAGNVLIAEMNVEGGVLNVEEAQQSTFNRQHSPVGYLISQDRYFKRDDVGIIYQLNVAPSHQRGLIGATLIKSAFERAAYGCRLFCCWCAQDIAANRFWESLGFIPLAYRAGSRSKNRVHIFWQRRVREGDVTTPYWFPSETKGGSIREDRLVLPIPPGTNWAEMMPVLLPSDQSGAKRLGSAETAKPRKKPDQKKRYCIALGGLRFASPVDAAAAIVVKEKRVRAKAPKAKNRPEDVAASRELRDRYLERFNSGEVLASGKYAVGRALESTTATPMLLLPHAACRGMTARDEARCDPL